MPSKAFCEQSAERSPAGALTVRLASSEIPELAVEVLLLRHQLQQHSIVSTAVSFRDKRAEFALAKLQPTALKRMQRILHLVDGYRLKLAQ